jgi:hypothetical protein
MSLPYSEGKQALESHTHKMDNTFMYEPSTRQHQQPFKTEYQRIALGGSHPNYPISVGGSQPISNYPFESQPAQAPVNSFPANVNPQQTTNPNNSELIRMESEPFRGPSGYFFNQDQNLSRGPSQLFAMEGHEAEGGNYNDFLRNNMGLRNNISLQSLNNDYVSQQLQNMKNEQRHLTKVEERDDEDDKTANFGSRGNSLDHQGDQLAKNLLPINQGKSLPVSKMSLPLSGGSETKPNLLKQYLGKSENSAFKTQVPQSSNYQLNHSVQSQNPTSNPSYKDPKEVQVKKEGDPNNNLTSSGYVDTVQVDATS